MPELSSISNYFNTSKSMDVNKASTIIHFEKDVWFFIPLRQGVTFANLVTFGKIGL